MLDLMRRHARSWLIKLALGGIIIVFVFWYGWSGNVEEDRSVVAEVNGTLISDDYFYLMLELQKEQIKSRFGGRMPEGLEDQLRSQAFKKQVANALVNGLLLQQEASRLGFFVTDEDLVNSIRSDPGFQRNGVFDSYRYEAFLNDRKLTAPLYEKLRREGLLEDQLVGLITDSVKTNPDKVKRMWHFQNDKFVLAMLNVEPEATPADAPVETKELTAYFERNRSKYEIPAYLNLEYVVFSWRDVLDKVSVSDDEARAYYQNHPAEFTEPAKVHARHILLKVPDGANDQVTQGVEKRMQEIRKRIEAGEDFAAVAREVSEDEATAEKGGDLGFFARGSLSPEVEQAAFGLNEGEMAQPILTRQGYHLLRVDERKPEKRLELAEVKEKIVKKLREEKARKKANEDAENFYELVYRREDLKQPAAKFGFQVKEGESITRAGGLPDLGSDPAVMDQAFQLNTGEVSSLVRSGDNFLVMKLVSRVDERLPEFDEVRREVAKDYAQQKAIEAANKKAEKIIAELAKESADPEAVAKEFGMTWQRLTPVSRTTGLVPRLGSGPEVIEMLTTITLEKPVFSKPIPISGGVAVVRLTDIEGASDRKYSLEAPAFENWVREVSRTEIRDGWIKRLKQTGTVVVNEERI